MRRNFDGANVFIGESHPGVSLPTPSTADLRVGSSGRGWNFAGAFSELVNRTAETQLDRDREQALAVLEKAGFIQRFLWNGNPDTPPASLKEATGGQGLVAFGLQTIVCNLDKFQGDSETPGKFTQLMADMGPFATSDRYKEQKTSGNPTIVDTFNRLFRDKQVYSGADWGRVQAGEQLPPKLLFCQPQGLSVSEATRDNYYLGLWQLPSLRYPDHYPGTELSFQAVSVLHTIFNPKFGAASRPTEGRPLLVNYPVRDSQTGERRIVRRPINDEFFRGWGLESKYDRHGTPIHQLIPFFYDQAPELTRYGGGLLKPEELFKAQEGSATDRRFTVARSISEGRNRYITFDSVRMRFLPKPGIDGDKVYRINPDFAVVTRRDQGRDQATGIVRIVTRETVAKAAGKRPGEKKLVYGGTVSPVSIREFAADKPETGIILKNFPKYLDLSLICSVEAKFKLSNLPITEQALAMRFFVKMKNPDELKRFLRTGGESGLRALILSERMGGKTDLLLRLARERPEVIGDIGQISRTISLFDSQVATRALDPASKIQADGLVNRTITETKSLLEVLEVALKVQDEALPVRDVEALINTYRQQIMEEFDNYFGLFGGNTVMNRAVRSLELLKRKPEAQAVFESRLKFAGESGGGGPVARVLRKIREFYRSNLLLYENADSTTGDTAQERANYRSVTPVERRKKVRGKVLDAGTGLEFRMVGLLQKLYPEAEEIVGIDLIQPDKPFTGQDKPPFRFVRQNLAQMNLPPKSVDEAVMFWSVINDLGHRGLLPPFMVRLSQAMKPGGRVFVGTPHLEGEGGWGPTADQFHAKHPGRPRGMIQATIDGRRKEFYIMPDGVVVDTFLRSGFILKQKVPWRTQAGMPRQDYLFEYNPRAAREQLRRLQEKAGRK